jgi:hypothetical protein
MNQISRQRCRDSYGYCKCAVPDGDGVPCVIWNAEAIDLMRDRIPRRGESWLQASTIPPSRIFLHGRNR